MVREFPAVNWNHRAVRTALVCCGCVGVFAFAVLIRLSSCYESFWIDELHSAWVIADQFVDVGRRAALGNQMPVYFWGLWWWQWCWGDQEIALRITSVLTIAIAAACLTLIVQRQTKSLVCGIASGVFLAVESNALFFGTELRPYALIVLVSTLALAAFLALWNETSVRRWRFQWMLTICLALGVQFQPTSFGVLLCLPATLFAVSLWRRRSWTPQFSVAIVVQAITVAAVLMWAWQFTLHSSWQSRSNWSVFAVPTWIGPYWRIWPWWSAIFIPMSLATVVRLITRHRTQRSFGIAVLLVGLTMGITFVYWLVAYLNWVPLWHRRYFIAVLPWLAAVPGLALSGFDETLRRFFFRSDATTGRLATKDTGRWRLVHAAGRKAVVAIGPLAMATFFVVMLMHQQGTWERFLQLPNPMVTRGENWRQALQWLEEQVPEGDLVFIDSGLIEANEYLDGVWVMGSQEQPVVAREYLEYPMRGPYRPNRPLLENTEPINRSLLFPLGVLGLGGETVERVWIVSRRNMRSMKAALKRSIRRTGPFDYYGVRVTNFGNVSIAEIPKLKKPKRSGWFIF